MLYRLEFFVLEKIKRKISVKSGKLNRRTSRSLDRFSSFEKKEKSDSCSPLGRRA
jgi:hypothetical protein